MPYNNSGTFEPLDPPDFPAVPGTTIRAEQYNKQIQDIADGLSTAVTRGGESQMTGNLRMNQHQLENLSPPLSEDQAVRQAALLKGETIAVDALLTIPDEGRLFEVSGDGTVTGLSPTFPGNKITLLLSGKVVFTAGPGLSLGKAASISPAAGSLVQFQQVDGSLWQLLGFSGDMPLIGDFLSTARNPGSNYLPLAGGIYAASKYPELAKLFPALPAGFSYDPLLIPGDPTFGYRSQNVVYFFGYYVFLSEKALHWTDDFVNWNTRDFSAEITSTGRASSLAVYQNALCFSTGNALLATNTTPALFVYTQDLDNFQIQDITPQLGSAVTTVSLDVVGSSLFMTLASDSGIGTYLKSVALGVWAAFVPPSPYASDRVAFEAPYIFTFDAMNGLIKSVSYNEGTSFVAKTGNFPGDALTFGASTYAITRASSQGNGLISKATLNPTSYTLTAISGAPAVQTLVATEDYMVGILYSGSGPYVWYTLDAVNFYAQFGFIPGDSAGLQAAGNELFMFRGGNVLRMVYQTSSLFQVPDAKDPHAWIKAL